MSYRFLMPHIPYTEVCIARGSEASLFYFSETPSKQHSLSQASIDCDELGGQDICNCHINDKCLNIPTNKS